MSGSKRANHPHVNRRSETWAAVHAFSRIMVGDETPCPNGFWPKTDAETAPARPGNVWCRTPSETRIPLRASCVLSDSTILSRHMRGSARETLRSPVASLCRLLLDNLWQPFKPAARGKNMNLSHARAITPIKDPLHGYMRFGIFERQIIDSPYFQRLHNVLQNSTTYVAYPANKNSRFSHSLGVAHLAGEMFSRSCSQASGKDLRKFLEQASRYIETEFLRDRAKKYTDLTDYKASVLSSWESSISGQAKFTHTPFLQDRSKRVTEAEEFNGLSAGFLIDTLWQSVRVCGLLHDVGHLPMSHSFEGAVQRVPTLFDVYSQDNKTKERYTDILSGKIYEIDEAANVEIIDKYLEPMTSYFSVKRRDIHRFINGIEIHERRSLAILNKIHQVNFEGKFKRHNNYKNIVFQISFMILVSSIVDKLIRREKKPNPNFLNMSPFFRVLKNIIAGEIDADRMDYTIRDGYSCGSNIGTFDIERVIGNSVLIESGARFRIAFYDRALSGIEQFFRERYEGYKYLIYHRTSARSEACLQELISRLFHHAFLFPREPIACEMQRFGFLHVGASAEVTDLIQMTEDTLETVDDHALLQLFNFVRRAIVGRRFTPGDAADPIFLEPIESLIEIVVRRDFSHIYNPFKFESFRDRLERLKGGVIAKPEFSRVMRFVSNKKHREEFVSQFKYRAFKQIGRDVVVVIDVQIPKIFRKEYINGNDKIELLTSKMGPIAVESRSAMLASMSKKDLQDIKLNIYFVKRGIKYWKKRKFEEIDQFLDNTILELYGVISDRAQELYS